MWDVMQEQRPLSIEELDEPLIQRGERFRRVRGARVLWADPTLLQMHFGSVISHSPSVSRIDESDAVEQFLLRHAPLISEAQLASLSLTHSIPVDDEVVFASRPPRYGRAAVVEVAPDSFPPPASPIGLLDIKGCGVRPGETPRPQFHRTGLLSLIEGIREVVMQNVIDAVFRYVGVPVRGVPLYALLDLGFRMSVASDPEPVALLVRVAHRRPPRNRELYSRNSPEHRAKLKIELLLRLFGITCANPRGRMRAYWDDASRRYRCTLSIYDHDEVPSREIEALLRATKKEAPAIFDILNIQLVRKPSFMPLEATIVDFGHYYVVDGQFEHPLVNVVNSTRLKWVDAIDHRSPWWVQPQPGISESFMLLARQETPANTWEWLGLPHQEFTPGLSLFCTTLARDVTTGSASRSEVTRRISHFVEVATRSLRPNSPPLVTSFAEWQSIYSALPPAEGTNQ